MLERYVSDLRMEIANTESLSWRQEMHADEDRAKRLLERLAEPKRADTDAGELHIVVHGFVTALP